MAFVCSWVFLVSRQQAAAVFASSPKPVVGKLLREFKNGPGLPAGSQAVVTMGRTRQTAVSWARLRPEGWGTGWCADTLGPNSSHKELNDLVQTLQMCLGHLSFAWTERAR